MNKPKKKYYIDFYSMIDLVGVDEFDEESGELIKFCKDNKVKIEKFKGSGFGDHRFIGSKRALNKIRKEYFDDPEAEIKVFK